MSWNVIKILRIFDAMFYFWKVSGFEWEGAINDEDKKKGTYINPYPHLSNSRDTKESKIRTSLLLLSLHS